MDPDNGGRCADHETLVARARLLADIRAFFGERGVLEADVPALSRAGALEPHLASIHCETARGRRYLHTSAEFGLKRLLAAGSGPIYQLSHVFRDGEIGRWHNPEFTMLEWYRPGCDEYALTTELERLLAALAIPTPVQRHRFSDVFRQCTGCDPFAADAQQLADCAHALGCTVGKPPADARDARPFWLDAIMGLYVVPRLGTDQPCLIGGFPPDMAGLTRIHPGQPRVAARFELYWQGIELANGGDELTDADALRQRFNRDLEARARQGLVQPPRDEQLLQALDHGMPQCSGVAVGVDRLLALRMGCQSLTAILPMAPAQA